MQSNSFSVLWQLVDYWSSCQEKFNMVPRLSQATFRSIKTTVCFIVLYLHSYSLGALILDGEIFMILESCTITSLATSLFSTFLDWLSVCSLTSKAFTFLPRVTAALQVRELKISYGEQNFIRESLTGTSKDLSIADSAWAFGNWRDLASHTAHTRFTAKLTMDYF